MAPAVQFRTQLASDTSLDTRQSVDLPLALLSTAWWVQAAHAKLAKQNVAETLAAKGLVSK